MLKQFVIERDITGVGQLTAEDLRAASAKSNEVIAAMAPRVQWQHSYVTADKVYCVYLAQSPEDLVEHARQAGMPADRISPVVTLTDPTTASR
jgi:Nickel responsive protein SCO4226-like